MLTISEYLADWLYRSRVGRVFHQPEVGYIATYPRLAKSAAVPVHMSACIEPLWRC